MNRENRCSGKYISVMPGMKPSELRRPPKGEEGLTLLEILAAVTILALMITPFSLVFTGSYESAKQEEEKMQAVHIARWALEEIKRGYPGYSLAAVAAAHPGYTIAPPVIASYDEKNGVRLETLKIVAVTVYPKRDPDNRVTLRSVMRVK
ncbi:hypothetical protein BSNK01_04170 [Bacillaceae bacterium]